MVDLGTVLAQDIADFARRVLAGNGTPQEVAALPSLAQPADVAQRCQSSGRSS